MISEGRAPYTQRANRSRPSRGSMPNQWSEVTPIVGSVSSAIRSWLNAVGVWPSSLAQQGREDRDQHEEQHDREADHGDLVVAQPVEGDL